MSMNDPIAAALSHILNCEATGKDTAIVRPSSKVLKEVLRILGEENYIGEFTEIDDGKGKVLRVSLLGQINKCGVIKPRFAVAKDGLEKFEKRFLPAIDFGVLIISTNKGIMTHEKAKEKGLGGRLVAFCY